MTDRAEQRRRLIDEYGERAVDEIETFARATSTPAGLDELSLTWGKRARDAEAMGSDFHNGAASAWRWAIRELRAALQGADR